MSDTDDGLQTLDRTRVIVLQQILAHDSGVLSRPELEARNPDVDMDTLCEHLETLVDREIPTTLDAPELAPDLPRCFCAVTPRGIQLLQEANLYDEIGVWNHVYNHVPVPADLHSIEEMERPSPDWYVDAEQGGQ